MSWEATVHLQPDTWVRSGTWPDPSTPTILGPPDLEEKVPDPKDVVLHAKLFSGGATVWCRLYRRYGHTLTQIRTHSLSSSLVRSLSRTHTII